MTLLRQMLLEVKNSASKIFDFCKAGATKQLKCDSDMSCRKIEDDCDTPNKKICTETNNTALTNNTQKLKKWHVAMLLSYCGANYHGMQVNSTFRTIESELFTALEKANSIPYEGDDKIKLMNFQRAARTDKGVSAARQVVSLKIASNYNIENINSFLPDDIKVFSIKRVTKGFNCKNDCVARTYSYTLPTFALAPELHKEHPKNFKITEEMITNVNNVLESFKGTHCFHNFTSKKDSRDPSAKRYIMSFITEKPFTEEGEEFVTLKIKGQSFMLHQIRKMVGYTIAVLKGVIPPVDLSEFEKEKKVSIPMAPGLGLILENIHYDRYNKKYGTDGIHESLTWDETDDEVEKFRKERILNNIVKLEVKEKQMFQWLQTLEYFKIEDQNPIETKSEEVSDKDTDEALAKQP